MAIFAHAPAPSRADKLLGASCYNRYELAVAAKSGRCGLVASGLRSSRRTKRLGTRALSFMRARIANWD